MPKSELTKPLDHWVTQIHWALGEMRRAGFDCELQIGEGLFRIRESGNYRTEPTFEAFCSAEFDLSGRRAYQLIAFWQTRQVLCTRYTNLPHLPSDERQTRELAPLLDAPGQMKMAWVKALEAAESPDKVTAKHIRTEVAKLLPAPEPEEQTEDTADKPAAEVPIQDMLPDDLKVDVIEPHVEQIIRSREPLMQAMRDITALRKRLKAVAGDEMAAFLSMQRVDTALKDAWRMLKQGMPWAPCGTCLDGCEQCRPEGHEKGLGWLPRGRYIMESKAQKQPDA